MKVYDLFKVMNCESRVRIIDSETNQALRTDLVSSIEWNYCTNNVVHLDYCNDFLMIYV